MDIEKQLERDVSIDVAFALQALRPGAQWVLRGESWSGLQWLDEEQEKPSEQDVVDEIARLELLKEQLEYRRDRMSEYLSLEEQLDLLYWDGVNGTTNWSDQIAAVKTKFPKPE